MLSSEMWCIFQWEGGREGGREGGGREERETSVGKSTHTMLY